ncbi:MAG: galactokinase [Candidatus Hydrogenedentes bacterium]|nr:galactokinase [Candidatus Hydrogenedentota bacterium]
MAEFTATVAQMRQRGEFFSVGTPLHVARAPGRLDLMGGNDDYTGGLVFEATIREATFAAVQLRDDQQIIFLNPNMRERGWRDHIGFTFDDLSDESRARNVVNRHAAERWTAYALGNFYWLKSRYPECVKVGANVYLESTVPLNKGVSSSAALEVAVMKAAAHAYGLELSGVPLATACQWVENVIAESACGIMDQITVILGDEGFVLPLVCQPCHPEPLIRLPEGLVCWAVDSGVSHAVTGVEYEAARAAAFMGYRLICGYEGLTVQRDPSSEIPRWTDCRWNGYLANVPLSIFRAQYESRLPEFLSGADFLREWETHVDPFTTVRPEIQYRIRANTRYAVEENHRVRLFSELARGTATNHSLRAFELMGDLMYQSHLAYTECGLGCEATDLLVSLAREVGAPNGIWGAKITGGGAGGTVAILGLKKARPAFDRIVARYAALKSSTPYVFEGSSPGADRSGVVVLET